MLVLVGVASMTLSGGSRMAVVKNLNQIKSNIAELELGRASSGEEFEKYKALIKRGTCFLPYEATAGLSFAPSRFIGYIGNKLANHAENPDRDGRVTNASINMIVGVKPIAHIIMEQVYIEFCETLKVIPSKKGRKYWITSEISELIDKKVENNIIQNPNLCDTEKQQLIKARIGQGAFRESLITMWSKCCATGCDYVHILRASHIKPWRDSTNEERLDKFNGLLLSPNLDALFDKGLISFSDNGKILISEHLSESAWIALGCPNDAKVSLRTENEKYMKWHRENVFKDLSI